MTRICSNCEYENQDDYRFCAKCGTPLLEGFQPANVQVIKGKPRINKKAILISYIITIFLSWGGFIISMFSKHSPVGILTFFGFFLPFYLIQAPINAIKKHGYIQLIISLIGVSLSFYVMLH
ncbi:zinc ribbon domain-containing protein [uncultured Methanobrevibacter sp.]|uniref:zinc ribbon domain-containing protein n=1 Tax=uncultured Methanobrevibacter sp. TaxID=253161 RepID=UPI0025EA8734|nr:zinc ribbon domain-containing protein [uncultured Methanobrevibacter sp.]